MDLYYNNQKISSLSIAPDNTVGQLKTSLHDWLSPQGITNYTIRLLFNNGTELAPVVFTTNIYDNINFLAQAQLLQGGSISISSETKTQIVKEKPETKTQIVKEKPETKTQNAKEKHAEMVRKYDEQKKEWDKIHDFYYHTIKEISGRGYPYEKEYKKRFNKMKREYKQKWGETWKTKWGKRIRRFM